MINLLFSKNYYQDTGARELAHRVKNKDKKSIYIMAQEIAAILPKNITIIPTPSRIGHATDTLELAKIIIEINDGKILDIIKGSKRESLYYIKKENKQISDNFFGFYLTEKEPTEPYYILDTVCDTGKTLKDIKKLFSNPNFVVHSKVI